MPSRKAKQEQDEHLSRRSLLHGAAAAGAAGLAVTALGAGVSQAASASTRSSAAAGSSDEAGTAAAGPIVVHVRDAKSGDIEVFSGTSQTQLRDKDLAARIARAIG
jgi:nitrous oxide reductase